MIFDVGDIIELYWYATETWEKVNYRGRYDEEKAVVVKDGVQLIVYFEDLRRC